MKNNTLKLFSIIMFFIFVSCSADNSVQDAKKYKNVILVQGALDIEVNTLINALENVKIERYGSWVFYIGTIKGKSGDNKVIVSRTEVGLVNASASTTIGIEKYHPTLVINQGTSGGHDIELKTGDIVLGTNIVNFGSFRTERSESSDQNNWIFMEAPQRLRDNNDNMITNNSFYSTAEYVEIAKEVPYVRGKLVEGTIGSADQWNRELERINMIHSKFNTSVEEMETVAVAQVCSAFNTPFLAVRILSNTDLHNEEFNPESAVWCNEYVIDLIKSI